MIKLLIKKFVPNSQNVTDKIVREKYSVLGGILGIICNLFLFAIKLGIGVFMNSIAIISDAFNNLSDTGSSIVSIIGAKMSNQKPDKEHPFGHGRIEYISSLIVAFIIMAVGIELLRGSFDKILNPEKLEINVFLIGILILSIFVKVWMYSYNKFIGKSINSQVLIATAKDSLNDVIATSGVIIATVAGMFLPFAIDGYIGVVVSILIIYTGFSIAKDTIDTLLGTSPSKETVMQIEEMIIEGEGIIGVHDLIVHDYGPGRVMASVHAEVPDNIDIIKIHEVIDFIETKIQDELGVHIVIHMDPVLVNCEKTRQIKLALIGILSSMNKNLSIHDFRITDGENRINLIFDLSIPYSINEKDRETIINNLNKRLKEIDKRYETVIKIDNVYNS